VPLDIEKMKKAAEYIVGEHDFKSFCSARTQVTNTVRTIYELKLEKQEDIIKIRIAGNGFLYNMVRIIVGTLIKVGMGVYPPEYVKEILEACDRNLAGPKAPAKGLTLVGIEYKA
jgi:tRNA pseudouridine38-40 synthase